MPKTIAETKDVTFASRGEIARPVDTGNTHANRGADVKRGDPEHAVVDNKVPGSTPQESGVVATGNASANRGADSGSINNPMPVVDNKVPGSKSALMKEFIERLSTANIETITASMNALKEDDKSVAVDNVAKVVAEDLKEVFGNAGLSEDFQNRAQVIFEAAVGAKVTSRNLELQEEYDAKVANLEEEITTKVSKEQEANIDKYLSYIAEQWAEENRVAIDSGIAAELSESFMKGIAKLLEDHWVSIPAEKVDALTAVTEELEESNGKVNKLTTDLIESANELTKYKRKEIVTALSEGLTIVERDRFVTLVESVGVSDLEDFKKKATVLKESVSTPDKTTPAKNDSLNEEVKVTPDAKASKSNKPKIEIYESKFRS